MHSVYIPLKTNLNFSETDRGSRTSRSRLEKYANICEQSDFLTSSCNKCLGTRIRRAY